METSPTTPSQTRSFTTIFLIEMWERFGFYGMQAYTPSPTGYILTRSVKSGKPKLFLFRNVGDEVDASLLR